MSQDPPLRTAIVGTGTIARIHGDAMRTIPTLGRLVAATDIDADQRAAFADDYDVRPYADLASLLRAEEPDLVHICTPPGAHHSQALDGLRAGSSVLVEKPPTLTMAELDDLHDAQGEQGPWFATVFQHRFGSGARRARALIDSGVLGRPHVAVCHTTWYRPQSYFDVPWRGRWDTEGGGPTMGHGIHQIDLLTALLGEWTEVTATARRQARSVDTEDLSLAHVAFANGAVASVVNSVLSPREESYIRIDLDHATLELTHLYGYGDANWRITPAPGHEERVNAAWEDGEWGTRSGHAAQLAAVLTALHAKEAPPVTATEARRTLHLVAGIYASAFQRRSVTPADVGPGSAFHTAMRGDGPPW
ncbi:Gfo/Idh/MocA family oxidoreductase [Spiractinospora alimapuensis]|nr:Gfo/Idh/MocA family oxidoreductase [Spiractinospora alimapuensis]